MFVASNMHFGQLIGKYLPKMSPEPPENSIDVNECFGSYCIYVSNHKILFFLSLHGHASRFNFFSFQPLACCVGRLFFFNSVVSAAVACAFNFSRFFLCFCCFVLLLVHAANLIWYAPHDDTLGERCLCCWNFSFRLFLSFDVQPECVCCYVCSCDCDCVCVFFVGALRLTTFTTLFMFT